MKYIVFSFVLASVCWGQNQDAATKIAGSVEPSEILIKEGTDCLTEAAKVLEAKEAAKYCLELRKLEVKRATKLANEAADATKNNWPRPTVINNGWGYGGGGYYRSGYSYRSSYRRPIVRRPVVKRPPPPPRPSPSSRRVSTR